MAKLSGLKFILVIGACLLMSEVELFSKSKEYGVTAADLKSSDKKILNLKRKIASDNKKYLYKLRKKEDKIFRILCISNPNQADGLFGQRSNCFANFDLKKINSFDKTRYTSDASLDSVFDRVHYHNILPHGSLSRINSANATTHVNELKEELQRSNDLKRYSNRRIRFLRDISASTKDDFSAKVTKSMSKDAYYFKQQLNDRKEVFASEIKKHLPGLDQMGLKENGMGGLCSLDKKFQIPEIPKNWGNGITGIDSLQKVEKGIGQQIKSIDSITPGSAEKKVKEGVQKISALKDPRQTNLEIHSAEDLPDFKPNPYKTKRIIDRVELGYDFKILPATFAKQTVDGMGINLIYHITPKTKLALGGNCRMQIQNNYRRFTWKYNGVIMESSIARQIYGKISALVELDKSIDSLVEKPFSSTKEIPKTKVVTDYDMFAGIQCEQKVGSLKSTISVLYKLDPSRVDSNSGLWAFRFGFGFGK